MLSLVKQDSFPEVTCSVVLVWELEHLKGYATIALGALTDLNGPVLLLLGPSLQPTQETYFSWGLGLQSLSELHHRHPDVHLHQSHVCDWPWTPLIQTSWPERGTCLITMVVPNHHWTAYDSWLPSPDLILTPSCELTSWLNLRFASSPWTLLMV